MNKNSEKINVTKTFMPPIEEYQAYIKQLWENGQITNQGPLLLEFEQKAKQYLGVNSFQFVENGTIALQIALRALDITEGEIITTPFSYVATVSSILWERCQPVFVDIEPDSLTIDPDKIEAAITKNTKAIMPVHVFGNPCDVEKIDVIAKKHQLKVIYDAAHAFGVRYKGKSLLDYGDISTCSFHATKLFHTIEGGAVIAKSVDVNEKLELIKRFGHNGDDHHVLGINAKANEFQAAMGLCNLKYVNQNINKRKIVFDEYDKHLKNRLTRPTIRDNVEYNYAYYPVLASSEKELLTWVARLQEENIFARRYFHPSLNTLSYLPTKQHCPISEDIAKRILCLPLHADLSEDTVRKISEVL